MTFSFSMLHSLYWLQDLLDEFCVQTAVGERAFNEHGPRCAAHFCIVLTSLIVVHTACRRSSSYVDELTRCRQWPWLSVRTWFTAFVPSVLLSMLLVANMRNIEQKAATSTNVTSNATTAGIAASIASHSLPTWLGGIGLAFVIKDLLDSIGVWDCLWSSFITHVFQHVSLVRHETSSRYARTHKAVLFTTNYDIRLFAILLSTLTLSDLYLQMTPHWALTNVIIFAYIYLGVAYVYIPSVTSSIVFLVGMCAFDTFWMFGVNLLSTVVKQTTAPVMILWPTTLHPASTSVWTSVEYAKLGSVDPLVIGIFMATIYRFAHKRNACSYIVLNHLATFIGLAITLAVSIYHGASTPAMVLPSILCVMCTLGNAWRRGELREIIGYNDDWRAKEIQI